MHEREKQFPTGQYGVIYVDPPWSYKMRSPKGYKNSTHQLEEKMKKIVIPPPSSGRKRKYPFNLLVKYGDNIFIETTKIHAARDAAYKYAKCKKINVATRMEGTGVRVYHAGAIDV